MASRDHRMPAAIPSHREASFFEKACRGRIMSTSAWKRGYGALTALILNRLRGRSAARVQFRYRHRTVGGKRRLALPAIAILTVACTVARGDNTPTAPTLTAPAATPASERTPVFTSSSFIVKLA